MLYTKDLINASDVILSLLCANDFDMVISGIHPVDLVINMNAELVKVVDWLKINKFSLTLNKTHL